MQPFTAQLLFIYFPALPLKTMQPNQMPDAVDLSSIPEGYVDYNASSYHNNQHVNSILILNYASSFNILTISFIQINLGSGTECVEHMPSAVFKILENHGNNQLYVCGDTMQPPEQVTIDISSANYLTFELSAESSASYGGFLLHYSGK